MIVKSYTGDYSTESFSDFSFFSEIKKIEKKFFVVDKKVYDLYKADLAPLIENQPLYIVEAIEENKNVDTALEIIEKMVELDSKRNTVLIAIGGGIVQDISAFISNIIYRGIKWILIPTTLLAQTDSCIGSKSSMNFKKYKNILGYFYPPQKIYINTQFVKTLDERDFFSGLGEILKCATMAGYESYLDTASHIDAIKAGDDELLQQEIDKALAFKKNVIEIDEFDTDYRNIMNFGHTFGHALESTSQYAVPHGQGVSFGMMIANEIAFARGYISKEQKNHINSTLKKIVSDDCIKNEYFAEDNYLGTLRKDKKYTGGRHTCIIFHGDGVQKHSDVTDQEVMDAVEKMLESI